MTWYDDIQPHQVEEGVQTACGSIESSKIRTQMWLGVTWNPHRERQSMHARLQRVSTRPTTFPSTLPPSHTATYLFMESRVVGRVPSVPRRESLGKFASRRSKSVEFLGHGRKL